jgi:hypothetical protein
MVICSSLPLNIKFKEKVRGVANPVHVRESGFNFLERTGSNLKSVACPTF